MANRNYTQLLGLTAGASVGANNATAFGKATQDISTNGADPGQNNFQMDGVAVNNIANAGSSNDGGIYAGIGIPNPDSIQEFKIQTSTYDASYGRNPGANVNVVTKSGTNSFHGTGFEFFRNSQLNANDFFYNRDTCPTYTGSCPKQVLNQNQFGGAVGGPIKKDKLFFFGSYQGTRQKNGIAAQGLTAGATLPPIPSDRTASNFAQQVAAANCHFPTISTFVEGGAPLACDGSNISPVALNILQLKNADGSYYIPSSSSAGFQTVSFSQPAIYNANQVILNGDYPVLGYDPDRSRSRLVVNEAEAERVRKIFVIFLGHCSLIATLGEIHKHRWRLKSWTTRKGEHHAGQPFDRHTLARLLSNVLYLGQVKYHGKVYPGEQPAIVDRKVWTRAQELLKNQPRGREDHGVAEAAARRC